jgi:hypothetical protein
METGDLTDWYCVTNATFDADVAHAVTEADARLIAAAPELLAALERLAAQIVESVIYDEARKGQDPQLLADVESARAAIAKARGA